MPKEYEGHKPRLEEFWANLQYNFEVRENNYYRLSVPQIRDFEIETNLPKELRDDGELLDSIYKEQEIDKKPLSPIRWSAHEDIDIDQITQMVINRTRQWLGLRVRPSASKGKQKESTSGMLQSRGYKDYAHKTRSSSQKNMPTDLDEAIEPEECTNELMKNIHEQMRKYELSKKAAEFGVTEGLGVVLLAKVLPVRTTIGKNLGEGAQEEEEQGKINEVTSTQPPSTAAAQALVTNASMPLQADTTTVPPRT